VQFEWDEEKDWSNQDKHGLGFERASLAFDDPNAVFLIDERFEYDDERWIALGRVGLSVIYVAHSVIEDHGEEIIRIISARKATPFEERVYGSR